MCSSVTPLSGDIGIGVATLLTPIRRLNPCNTFESTTAPVIPLDAGPFYVDLYVLGIELAILVALTAVAYMLTRQYHTKMFYVFAVTPILYGAVIATTSLLYTPEAWAVSVFFGALTLISTVYLLKRNWSGGGEPGVSAREHA